MQFSQLSGSILAHAFLETNCTDTYDGRRALSPHRHMDTLLCVTDPPLLLVTGIAMRSPARSLILVLAAVASEVLSAGAADVQVDETFFELRVRPVLAGICAHCHGSQKQEANVRVDSLAALLGRVGSRRVIEPGDPNRSLLIRVVRQTGKVKMPPGGRLPEQSIAALERWVEAGAPWPAQRPIQPPEQYAALAQVHWAFRPPEAVVPPVHADPWLRTPVDAFLLAKLREHSLEPSPQADRRTLIRRLYYDLIGLPPEYDDIVAFERDERPDAYERLVDRLLASPRYGERWARHWLDVARYADTKGYVFSFDPRYPFSYTYRDYVIRAFNRDLPYDQFIKEQIAADRLPSVEADRRRLAALGFLVLGRRFNNNIHDIIDDRIDLIGRGLLGLTLACARCHDHKYDAITMRDYYALYGVFASCEEPEELPIIGPPEDEKEYEKYAAELAKRRAAYRRYWDQETAKLRKQLRERTADYMMAAIKGAPGLDLPADAGLSFDENDLRPQFVRRWRQFLAARAQPNDPIFGPLSVAARQGMEAYRRLLVTAGERGGYNRVLLRELNARQPATLRDLIEVYAELLRRAHELVAAGAAPDGAAHDWQALARVLSDQEGGVLALDERTLRALLSRAVKNRLSQLQRAIEAWIAGGNGGPPRAMVLVDRPRPVTPRVFLRGDPRRPGPTVPRRFLAALSRGEPKPFQEGSGRKELAEAIASPDNPLTGRVFVNRVWMWHMGTPIVESVDDFGLRCPEPLHRDLLDWLTRWFIAHNWSLKRLHREIVLSAAYRQRSALRPDAMAVDPENRLYWRMNRRRLEFEPMWDSLLAVAKRLDLRMGGRSVQLFGPRPARRRAVYGYIDRQDLAFELRIFDFASPDSSSPRRPMTTVPQQGLYFLNSPMVIEQADAVASLPAVRAASTPEDRVRALYRAILRREPTAEELSAAVAAYEELVKLAGARADARQVRQRATAALAQVLLCSNEFVFID